jgi:hypothetical protein
MDVGSCVMVKIDSMIYFDTNGEGNAFFLNLGLGGDMKITRSWGEMGSGNFA